MTTIRLVTDEDMRAITSQTLDRIKLLPHLYIPTDDSDVMRSWGVAMATGDDDMRAITSQNLEEIPSLPHLYIATHRRGAGHRGRRTPGLG
jgi:hypothetical protein